MLEPGIQVGRYEIQRRLGRGGMGSVYVAHDPVLGRLVAIKVFTGDLDLPDLHERFSREARAAAVLSHPNIVTVHDFGEYESKPYIVMEYVAGETLAGVIRRRAPALFADKLRWMEELCAGAGYAHQMQVLHRDIKPSNLVIDRTGHLKILDFGIARLFGIASDKSVLVGTPAYMSPEQITGAPVDQRSDQFSIGVVFYELLTYTRAFPGDTLSTITHRVLHEEPVPLNQLVPEAPPEIIGIIEQTLKKNAAERFPDSEALGSAIARVRQKLASSAVATTAVAPDEPHISPSAHDGSAVSPGRDDDISVAPLVLPPPEPRQTDRESLARRRAMHVETALERARKLFAERQFGAALDRCHEALILDETHAGALSLEEDIQRAILARESAPVSPRDVPVIDEAKTVIGLPPARDAGSSSLASPAVETPVLDPTILFGSVDPRAQPDDLLGARLLVIECRDPRLVGRSFPLAGKSVVLGRDGDWLGVADPGWSRQHAAIDYVDGGFILRDLGSSNGTRVNGRLVPAGSTGQALFFGARIAIGSAVLTFSHSGDTSLPDLTGAEVDGRYVLEERLREGPKGALYAARDTRLPGRVAVKILSPELARYAGYRTRFQREAELARQLQHPHICKVLDYGKGLIRYGGRDMTAFFLCLELMEGGNLADRLERQDVLDKHRVAQWLDRIASALAYAHRRGVVHGDIKPTALVFDGDDNPYITDFAIAQNSEMVVGTPAYMAPEQWEGTAPTPAVDQFGLAAVGYYMITGSRAFEGQDHPEIRRRNFATGPLPAHAEAERNGKSGVLRSVSYVFSRALATRPEDRYVSIDQFAGALTAALIRPARRADAAKLFFSYQRENMAGWVNYFADRVRANGLSVFVDTHNIDSTGVVSEQVSQAIEDALVFVCFVGERTLESKWVRDEITLAYQFGKPMIPVFQEGYVRPAEEALSPGIRKLLMSQGVHLHDRRNLNPEGSVADLVTLLRSLESQGGLAGT
jgi:serine/threonine protein kinase